jgi:hypothetical protein
MGSVDHLQFFWEALLHDNMYRWKHNDSKHRWKGNDSKYRWKGTSNRCRCNISHNIGFAHTLAVLREAGHTYSWNHIDMRASCHNFHHMVLRVSMHMHICNWWGSHNPHVEVKGGTGCFHGAASNVSSRLQQRKS